MDVNYNLFADYSYGRMSQAQTFDFDIMLRKNERLREEYEVFLNKISSKLLHGQNAISLVQNYLLGKMTNDDRGLFVTLLRYKQKLAYEVNNYLQNHLFMYSLGKINLFDEYAEGKLPTLENNAFELRLKTDNEFAADFKVYLMTVDGVCREARQDDMDFGMAIKNLTKEQLQEIIAPRHRTL